MIDAGSQGPDEDGRSTVHGASQDTPPADVLLLTHLWRSASPVTDRADQSGMPDFFIRETQRAIEEAVGRVVIESVAVEHGIVLCVMAAGGDHLEVWGQSGKDLSRAMRRIQVPPAAQSMLMGLVDKYYRLYQERNQVIHGVVDRASGKSLKMRRVPTQKEERQAFREALERDSLAGHEIRDADLSDLHDLANRFIELGRDAFRAVFDLEQIRREGSPERLED